MKVYLPFVLVGLFGCSNNLVDRSQHIYFVFEKRFIGRIQAVEDPDLRIDYRKEYRLVPVNGVVRLPKGVLHGDPPLFFTVTKIVDNSGRLLGAGDDSRPGEYGYTGMSYEADKCYLHFGIVPPLPTRKPGPVGKFQPIEPKIKVKLTVPPGYHGEALLEEDPDLELDFTRTYELAVVGGKVKVPKGFLKGSSGTWPYDYDVLQLRDTNGNVISKEKNPPPGQVGARSISKQRLANGTWIFMFDIWDGVVGESHKDLP